MIFINILKCIYLHRSNKHQPEANKNLVWYMYECIICSSEPEQLSSC